MTSVIPWTEIEGFHNIRKYTVACPEILKGVVRYAAKVKLHGNNAGVQILSDGSVIAQSRTTILTPENDLAGFAKWVAENAKAFNRSSNKNNVIIFGEWCGPGVQHGVAINQVKDRVFAVFAARMIDTDALVVDPESLSYMIKDVQGAYVLPWHGEIEIDWSVSDEELEKKVAQINEQVMEVEKNDPWVEATFGIKGTGEGLVFYPINDDYLGYENYCNFVFKAKGEKHRVIKAKAPAQVNPEVAKGLDQFTELVLTEPRLEQGAEEVKKLSLMKVADYDKSNIGRFVDWVRTDVMKECQAELEASGLDWKRVQKVVGDKARNWYLNKVREHG